MTISTQNGLTYRVTKKIYPILFLLLSLHYLSQQKDNYRIYYELNYKSSVINPNLNKELFVLDYNTKTKESIFYNQSYVYNDSINTNLKELMANVSIDINTDIYKKMYLKDIIYHDNKSKQSTFSIYTSVDGDNFQYQTEAPQVWKIYNSSYQINNYECRKATTYFGGRKWIAYFTESIPFNVGPYKFSELPGLIVKIFDTENNFEFNIAGIKKIQDFNPLKLSKYINISEKSFYKVYYNFLLDPSKKLREGIFIAPDGSKFVMRGNSFTKNDFDEKNSEVYKNILLNDNCIEITSQKCILEKVEIKKLIKD